jgi:glycerophosphoryl diester phosphodiesterase
MSQAPAEPRPLRERLRAAPGRAWVVGHRGAMGYCPENTLPSFERARALGADWVELDVHLTRDGRLAVIHDEQLERTTDGHGLVGDHTLEELKQRDAGGWFAPDYRGLRIPSLEDVLAWARDTDVLVDIEIKNAPLFYDGIERAVLDAVRSQRMLERCIVISFDHGAVARVRELDKHIVTGVLYVARPADAGVSLARAVGADVVLPHWSMLKPGDVDLIHHAGFAVAPWASSDASVLRTLIHMGVDAIATNHPDVLRHVMHESEVPA